MLLRSPPFASALTATLAVCLACSRGSIDSPVPERRAAAVRRAGARGDLAVLLVGERDASPLVRCAAAEAFATRADGAAADALGALLLDVDPDVAAAAAAGLAGMPAEPRAKEHLVQAYARGTPAARAAIAAALGKIGTSLRDAIELEARVLWDRNVAALDAGPAQARAGAAEELGASGRSDAVTRLLPLADPNRDRDPALLAAAARGLGEAGDWQARPFLEDLLGAPDPAVGEAAAEALGRLGDPGAADALAEASSAGSGRLAAAGVDALAALPQATEVGVALCQVAARTGDPAIAARAARQARQREADCPEKIFLARLGRGQDAAVLSAVAELGSARDAARAVAERVLAAVRDGRLDAAARPLAAQALGRLGWPDAAAPLLERARALLRRAGDAPPPDAEELGATLAAVGRLRADGAAALLAPLANDAQPAVRAGALEGLAAASGQAALPALAAGLRDPAERVRNAAARALASLGSAALAPLAQAAVSARPEELEWRAELAAALGATGAPEAIPPIAALLDGASVGAAATALARIGQPAGAKPLVDLLGRPDAPARADAIEAIAQLGAPDAAPAVAAQLTSDRPEVRAAAARALGRLRYEAASSTLEALRSDYYRSVRRAAVEALAKLPSGAARAHP